jgi:cytochrome c biogenesis protein CcmG/thiol:disulfide interchange protein DsbE
VAAPVNQKSNRVFGSVAVLLTMIFLGLMLYAMSRDANVLPSLLVGKPAPRNELIWDNGERFMSHAVLGRGRWVLINFWNTTCVVCRYEAPELERLYREVVQKSDEAPFLISVNIQDSPEQVAAYKRSLGLTYPVVLDSNGKMSLDYGVYGTPETFFVDPSGVVRHRVAGEVDGQTALRFMAFLDQSENQNLTATQAMDAFAQVRAARLNP